MWDPIDNGPPSNRDTFPGHFHSLTHLASDLATNKHSDCPEPPNTKDACSLEDGEVGPSIGLVG